MRLQRFYQLTILFPLLGLVLVAALRRGDVDLVSGLAEGGRARRLYPRSATRGGGVALVLMALFYMYQKWRYDSAPGHT